VLREEGLAVNLNCLPGFGQLVCRQSQGPNSHVDHIDKVRVLTDSSGKLKRRMNDQVAPSLFRNRAPLAVFAMVKDVLHLKPYAAICSQLSVTHRVDHVNSYQKVAFTAQKLHEFGFLYPTLKLAIHFGNNKVT